ncbi:MAG: lysylphosphatidylglycerol synthase transmembrane domain-containing protein [bacterium]|nr:lysylphosphatidylglycerol synthase transmembrane domain-containing protein [bacterium]
MIKKILLLLISFLIGIGLFFWVFKMVGWGGVKEALTVFTGWHGLAILGLTFVMAAIATLKWQEILKGVGVKVSFGGLVGPYLAAFAVMFLAPILVWGGEIFRTYILKERNSIPWSKGMASVVIDRILEWTANLTVILFGGLFFLFLIGFPPTKILVVFGGIFLILLGGMFFFYFKILKRESIVSFFIGNDKPLETEKEIFDFFKNSKRAMWKSFALAFLRVGVACFRVWLLVVFLGKSLGLLSSFSILTFSYLSMVIPIPAALGSHEALQTFAFGSLGLGASTATAFTMIIRGAELMVALAGVIILFKLGIALVGKNLFKKLSSLSGNNGT